MELKNQSLTGLTSLKRNMLTHIVWVFWGFNEKFKSVSFVDPWNQGRQKAAELAGQGTVSYGAGGCLELDSFKWQDFFGLKKPILSSKRLRSGR